MKFDDLLAMVAGQAYFDLATLVQLSGEQRPTLRTQISRWLKAGKLLPLRRGMYALAGRYRADAVNPAELANQIYRPSYLSLEWALGFHGLIPEMVVTYTSVTSREPRQFVNHFGRFDYRHVKQAAFFGFVATRIQGHTVMLATPEKALLDYWYLNSGPWTPSRMAEMRFQHGEQLDRERLQRVVDRFASPRLHRALDVWREFTESEAAGTVEL
jgi:predicted transcriptional regulator of viral defense system